MRILRYLVGMLLLICMLSLASVGSFVFLIPKAPNQTITPEKPIAEILKPGTYNILCAGIDKGETNADTIVLISFDSVKKEVNLLSIPRDTMSNVSRVVRKINASFGEGGIENTIKEVEMLTNLHIDRFIVTTFDGFEKVIDALGGIDMEIPESISYQDTHQDLNINLQKGLQHLDGKTALHFVRYRYGYNTGDIGRIGAQQIFFKNLANKLTSSDMIKALPALAETLRGDMKTNLSIPEIFWFAKESFSIDLSKNVHMFLLPGSSRTVDGLSYYIPSAQGIVTMLNKHFIKDETKKVTTENLNLVPDAASVTQDFLTEGDKPTPKDANNNSLEPEHSYNPYQPIPLAPPKPVENTPSKKNIA